MRTWLRHVKPDSLWGQTVALTALIVGLAQILSIVLFTLLVLRPELQRVAGVMAQNVASISETMAEVPPAERAILMQHLAKSSYIEVWTGDQPPDDLGPKPRLLERVFMRALVEYMGEKADLTWRTDRGRKLWIHVWMGDQPYWISVKSPPLLGPTDLVMTCGLVTFLLALAAAGSLNGRLLRPLNELRRATDGYRLAQIGPPLREDGPREIAALSHSFNVMTERLARADADRAVILAGISHDVRTPLAKLKLAFEMMDCDDAELTKTAQRQIDSIDRILSQFLMFARGFDAEPVAGLDPRILLKDMLGDYGAMGVVTEGDAPDGRMSCRPEALRRAVINLVENALRYGVLPVRLGVARDADGWLITVHDRGQGVPEAQLETLKAPFVRGDAARQPDVDGLLQSGGTGLGLAMVDQIAKLHGGSLVLRNLDDGFVAEVRLPVRS